MLGYICTEIELEVLWQLEKSNKHKGANTTYLCHEYWNKSERKMVIYILLIRTKLNKKFTKISVWRQNWTVDVCTWAPCCFPCKDYYIFSSLLPLSVMSTTFKQIKIYAILKRINKSIKFYILLVCSMGVARSKIYISFHRQNPKNNRIPEKSLNF